MDLKASLNAIKNELGFLLNRNKSSVKFYELASLGVSCVARGIPPYSDDIVDGYSGLLYNSPEEFEAKVSELIEDPIKRVTMSSNAQKYVRDNRNLEDITRDLVTFLQGVSDVSRNNNIKI